MCEENTTVQMNVVATPHKRYHVNANRSMYFSAEFDTQEEAVQAAAQLVSEGYAVVAIRDNEQDKDIW